MQALAMLPNMTYPPDIFPSDKYVFRVPFCVLRFPANPCFQASIIITKRFQVRHDFFVCFMISDYYYLGFFFRQ